MNSVSVLSALAISDAVPAQNLGNFVTVMLLTFSIFMVLAGAFTSYFGTGKSRAVGAVLLVVGIIVAIVWLSAAQLYSYTQPGLGLVIWGAFLSILAAIIGAVIAVLVFLFAIMKT
jgi:hypothetical protein